MENQKKMVEFIESYIKGVNGSADYQWNDNHGELVRCKDCRRRETNDCPIYANAIDGFLLLDEWFCANGEKKQRA